MRIVAAGVMLSLCAASALASDPAAARRTLTPDDLYRVLDVSDPQVSPEGLEVAYVVSANDREADEARSAIWMVSWDGKQRLALTAAADGTEKPRWSPDGRYLAFMSKPAGSDKAQIMLLDRRGGDASPLTKVTGDIGDYAWSPDGKRLVFTMTQTDAGTPLKPIVIGAMHFKQDADGYIGAEQRQHLYLFDVADKRVEALTADSSYNEDLPTWSADGSQIAFVRTRELGPDQDGRADIDIVESKAGAVPVTVSRPYSPNSQKLAWSPDGKLIAYMQGIEPKFNAYMQDCLWIVPAGGGTPRSLTGKLDRAVMSFVFSGDSAAIDVIVEDDDTTYPARVDLGGGSIVRTAAPSPFVVSALSNGGGHTALLKTDDGALAEVFALEDGRMRQLTAHNDAFLAELKLGSVETLTFKSKDGTEVHGMMVKPPSFVAGRKYPALLWIHGGPNGHDEHSLELDGYQFEPQMFAAKGFVVLRVNYRGGSGRGGAYAKAIYADWGHKEVQDLLAGVDRLVALGIADPARLAVGGWSYGGILTDYTIASDGRFKAAISGAGSGNQLSMYGSDEYVMQYNAELGPPWRALQRWLKVSYPFFHADRIKTPTLFLGGDKDFNVPVAGGEQMYEALSTLGVPAQLVVYPGQNHLLTRPSYIRDRIQRYLEWFDRYLKPPAD
jgi:dipeptidyl aminopeptidase/acylaminoacyl peptidase